MARHDELRKTWAPGQLWETLVDGCTQWVPVADAGRAEPAWDEFQAYRPIPEPDFAQPPAGEAAPAESAAPEPVYWQWRRTCDAWTTAFTFPTEPAVTAPGTEKRPLYAGPVVGYKEGQA